MNNIYKLNIGLIVLTIILFSGCAKYNYLEDPYYTGHLKTYGYLPSDLDFRPLNVDNYYNRIIKSELIKTMRNDEQK